MQFMPTALHLISLSLKLCLRGCKGYFWGAVCGFVVEDSLHYITQVFLLFCPEERERRCVRGLCMSVGNVL